MFIQIFIVLSPEKYLIQRNYLNSIDMLTYCIVIHLPGRLFSLVICTSSGIFSGFVPITVGFSFTKEVELFINIYPQGVVSVFKTGVLCHLLV